MRFAGFAITRFRIWASSLLLLIACGTLAGDGRTAAIGEEPKKEAEEVALEIMNFEQVEALIAKKKGKIVVMDCWATWCSPCVKEFPGLVKLHKKYGAEKIACISLSFDNDGATEIKDAKAAVLEFLKEQEATFDNLLSEEASDELYAKMKLSAIPAVYVYDAEGKQVRRFDNSDRKKKKNFTYEDVEALVEELMAGKTPDK